MLTCRPTTHVRRGRCAQAGGNVLRLVGLYHAQRGAHTFFIKQGSVARPGGYVVNLLHYEDAASMGAAVRGGGGD